MKKFVIVMLALALAATALCAQGLAAKGDITVRDVEAYEDPEMTQPVTTIKAGTSVLVGATGDSAKIKLAPGKVYYIESDALLGGDITSGQIATLPRGTRVYQRAVRGSRSLRTKGSVTVSVCLVDGSWALIQSTGKQALYGFVRVDRLTNIRAGE